MKFKTLAIAAAMALALAGCGGGDGGSSNDGDNGSTTTPPPPPPPPPPPVVTGAGFYSGTTTDDSFMATTMAFADGSYYVIFSEKPLDTGDQPFNDFVAGKGTYDSGNFTSTEGRYYNDVQVMPITASASYTVKSSISGTLTPVDPENAVEFTGTYDPTFEATPSLSAITGAFVGYQGGASGGIDGVTLNISTTGAVTGNANGCSFTGTVTPKTDGNAYDLQFTQGAAPCVLPGKTFSGVALFRGSVLFALATASDSASGLIFEGTKAPPK